MEWIQEITEKELEIASKDKQLSRSFAKKNDKTCSIIWRRRWKVGEDIFKMGEIVAYLIVSRGNNPAEWKIDIGERRRIARAKSLSERGWDLLSKCWDWP